MANPIEFLRDMWHQAMYRGCEGFVDLISLKARDSSLTSTYLRRTLISSFSVSSVEFGIVAETKTSCTAGGASCSRSLIGWTSIYNIYREREVSSVVDRFTSNRRITSSTAGLNVMSNSVSASSMITCRRFVPSKRRSMPKCSSNMLCRRME